jgi:hypothetical protein
MFRALLTALSALSLAVCVAAAAVWAWGGDVPIRDMGDWGLWCRRGSLVFKTLRYIGERPGGKASGTVMWDEWRVHWQCGGLEYGQGEFIYGPYRYATTQVGVPLWFVALLAAPLPVWHAGVLTRRRLARRRAARNHCVRCGYDLRATPGRCPECGAMPVAKEA